MRPGSAEPVGGVVLAQAQHAPAAPADTHAATAEPGGGKHGAFPPFAPEHFASQLLWLALTFGALYLVLSRLALPRIGSILEVRRSRIDSDLAEAQRLKSDTDAAIAAYERALAEARGRAQAIASENREGVTRRSDEARKALEAELGGKLAAAEAQIASSKQAALANVRSIAADAAGAIVERLTGGAPTAAEVEAAVDATLARR